MIKRFNYNTSTKIYPSIVEEYTFSFGKAVKITIYKNNGEIRNKIKMVCQPEFDGYEQYQCLSIQELMAIAIERINSGKYDLMLDDAKNYEIELLLRFNSCH